MAIRALVYSKNPMNASVLAPVFKGLGMEAEVCSDALNAIEKGTKQPFSCVIVDWVDQPEAAFLLRRARVSALNPNITAIAIVDHEPSAATVRDHRLDYFLYRPISVGEAAAVLAKACGGMQAPTPVLESEPEPEPELQGPLEHFESDKAEPKREEPGLVSVTDPVPKQGRPRSEPETAAEAPEKDDAAGELNVEVFASDRSQRVPPFRAACAVVLALAAAFCVWRAGDTIEYLFHTREGAIHVLKESLAVFFFTSKSVSPPIASAGADSRQDAFFARSGGSTGVRSDLGVVATEANVPEASVHLPRAFDFPLPTPEFSRPEPPPVHVRSAQVPDSLRASLPIGPPVIATGPTQIMPVSAPLPPIPQFSEPVRLNEETARTMLVHTVEPAYPREAAAQKLQGPVVLEALVGRDGSVQDLKIVRGYFVLSRAAIAAVKQWRFQPYIVNGHAAQMQTNITINFSRP